MSLLREPSRLAASYAEARAEFLAAAARAGAEVESSPHPLTGLEGEPLAVDVAWLGPRDATAAVLIVSGTHGVEGYLGSALQVGHLDDAGSAADDTAPTGDTDVAQVFVHALNPYGFSWVRRVNEDNVDLNRNFVDWDAPLPRNTPYADLADIIVPTSWTEDEQERTLLALLAEVEATSLETLQQTISGGQYDHPTGLFYGGSGPTWSNDWLRSFCAERLGEVERLAVIDLHTGLGPWGHGELISSERPGTAAYDRQRSWWDGVISLHEAGSVSAELVGEWLADLHTMAPRAEVTAIAVEYGTVDPITVLQSLRADAVLHGYRDPAAPDAAQIRAQVRAAFLDDDPAWLEACRPRYAEVVAAAVAQLGRAA